ncbi:hypothetical protein WA588_005954, partial [Blastocystis sp. NMH]
MSGSGYDMDATIFSPEGRIFQVEYASKAVADASTCIGVNCKDGVVVAVEKTLNSPFIMDGSNKHINILSKHIGAVFGGYIPDGRYAIDRARDHCRQFQENFGEEITPKVLAESMGQFVHQFTCFGGYRPLGINVLFAGYDNRDKKYHLYRITPSGQCYCHFAESIGKGRQSCKADIEKHNLMDLTVEEALPIIAKMLCELHTESKKPYELEFGYASDATDHAFIRVDNPKRDELVRNAVSAIRAEETGPEEG